ncbi:MAG: AbrB/MazE/SpoVT family DNA-binding domain-containing protein [Actinomycetota bacterium]
MIKKIDKLGRVVLPKGFRNMLGIEIGDPLNVDVEGSRITISPAKRRCVFCGSTRVVASHRDKQVCAECLESLKRSATE